MAKKSYRKLTAKQKASVKKSAQQLRQERMGDFRYSQAAVNNSWGAVARRTANTGRSLTRSNARQMDAIQRLYSQSTRGVAAVRNDIGDAVQMYGGVYSDAARKAFNPAQVLAQTGVDQMAVGSRIARTAQGTTAGLTGLMQQTVTMAQAGAQQATAEALAAQAQADATQLADQRMQYATMNFQAQQAELDRQFQEEHDIEMAKLTSKLAAQREARIEAGTPSEKMAAVKAIQDIGPKSLVGMVNVYQTMKAELAESQGLEPDDPAIAAQINWNMMKQRLATEGLMDPDNPLTATVGPLLNDFWNNHRPKLKGGLDPEETGLFIADYLTSLYGDKLPKGAVLEDIKQSVAAAATPLIAKLNPNSATAKGQTGPADPLMDNVGQGTRALFATRQSQRAFVSRALTKAGIEIGKEATPVLNKYIDELMAKPDLIQAKITKGTYSKFGIKYNPKQLAKLNLTLTQAVNEAKAAGAISETVLEFNGINPRTGVKGRTVLQTPKWDATKKTWYLGDQKMSFDELEKIYNQVAPDGTPLASLDDAGKGRVAGFIMKLSQKFPSTSGFGVFLGKSSNLMTKAASAAIPKLLGKVLGPIGTVQTVLDIATLVGAIGDTLQADEISRTANANTALQVAAEAKLSGKTVDEILQGKGGDSESQWDYYKSFHTGAVDEDEGLVGSVTNFLQITHTTEEEQKREWDAFKKLANLAFEKSHEVVNSKEAAAMMTLLEESDEFSDEIQGSDFRRGLGGFASGTANLINPFYNSPDNPWGRWLDIGHGDR